MTDVPFCFKVATGSPSPARRNAATPNSPIPRHQSVQPLSLSAQTILPDEKIPPLSPQARF
jgi:hypothetical protein